MMRSLFSGVSGLKNHQTRMDVIGNNIANVNTIGFKGGSVSFQDIMSQTLQGATAAQGARGGTNPMQIGLGMGVASIDTNWTDGSYMTTGKTTDMGIQGQGFFEVTDGTTTYYTRAGNFDFDTNGNLIVTGTGNKVLGYTADNMGNIQSTIAPIQIPSGTIMPGLLTTGITYAKNLSADAPVGQTQQTSIPIFDAEGKPHNANVTFTKIGEGTWMYQFTGGDGAVVPETSMGQMTFNPDGTLASVKTIKPSTIVQNTAAFSSIQLNNRMGSEQYSTFAGYDASGEPHVFAMKIVNTGNNTWSYSITEPGVSDTTSLTSGTLDYSVVPPATLPTYNNFPTTFNYTPGGGTAQTMTITPPTVNVPPDVDSFQLNSISQMQPTSSLAISDIMMDDTGSSSHDKYFTVLDQNLTPRVFKMTVTNDTGTSWKYSIVEAGVTGANPVKTGAISYNALPAPGSYSGFPTSFSFTTGTTSQTVSFDTSGVTATAPNAGTFAMSSTNPFAETASQQFVNYVPVKGKAIAPISLGLNNLKQWGGESTVEASNQNGYAQGTLQTKSVDSTGTIIGTFSNGRSQALAQVVLATFNNPGGLTKVGDTLFIQSNNSGIPQTGKAGSGGRGVINPGTLEMSNIDLSAEFSNMIITQRGFQSNSKIISVADEMLQELVNLKR